MSDEGRCLPPVHEVLDLSVWMSAGGWIGFLLVELVILASAAQGGRDRNAEWV